MGISEVTTSSPHPSVGSEEMDISEDEEEAEPKRNENLLPAICSPGSRPRDEKEITMPLNASENASPQVEQTEIEPAQAEEPEIDPYSTEAEDLPAPFYSPPTLQTAHDHWTAAKLDKSLKSDSTIPALSTTYTIPPPQLLAATTSSIPLATPSFTGYLTATPYEANSASKVATLKNERPSRRAKRRIIRKGTDFGSWSSPEDTFLAKKNF